VEELLAERDLHAVEVGSTLRPRNLDQLRPRLKPTNDSWRVDETYIRVKGEWRYLYRAVDSTGATLDFLLSAKQDAAAAKRFLAKALGRANHPTPRVINTEACRLPAGAMALEQRVISARGHLQEEFLRCSSRGIEQSFPSPLPAASHRAPTNPRFPTAGLRT
jgi:transposase-like protein